MPVLDSRLRGFYTQAGRLGISGPTSGSYSTSPAGYWESKVGSYRLASWWTTTFASKQYLRVTRESGTVWVAQRYSNGTYYTLHQRDVGYSVGQIQAMGEAMEEETCGVWEAFPTTTFSNLFVGQDRWNPVAWANSVSTTVVFDTTPPANTDIYEEVAEWTAFRVRKAP